MKKIILTGANGQLGKALKKELSRDFAVSAFGKDELDLTNFAKVEKTCAALEPDFVVNAAAFTAVDRAESERDLARAINAEAVGKLAEICRSLNTKLIHFSTDYVFDGANVNGYAEDAEPHPVNFYGQSKLEGEKKIQASGCDFAIIRTSWLFGDGQNFVNTMLRLASVNAEIKVVSDQVGSPTFTEDLARMTREILNRLPAEVSAQASHSRESGNPDSKNAGGNPESKEIFHVTNSGTTSWANFARKIFELKNLPTRVIDITTAEFPTPAERPRNSILLNTKLPQMRSFEEALADFLRKKG
ncbi:MAG: dTDP-4-dehydrorhamnose reductase [Patescibacteria group bacterium]